MPRDIPPDLITEEAFALWCEQRQMDETDEAWRAYEAWLGDRERDE